MKAVSKKAGAMKNNDKTILEVLEVFRSFGIQPVEPPSGQALGWFSDQSQQSALAITRLSNGTGRTPPLYAELE